MHTRTSDLSCLQNEHEVANFSYCGEEAHDSGNREKDACKSMQTKMPGLAFKSVLNGAQLITI